MKYLFMILAFTSFINASMLFDKSYPLCIEDYYVKNGELFYLKSSNNKWGSTTNDKLVRYIYHGYDYNSSSGKCLPSSYVTDLGLSYFDFHFLMALSGLLFSFLLFWLLSSFMMGL